MGKIRRDFLRGELRRLALCAAGFGLCLLVLLHLGRHLLSHRQAHGNPCHIGGRPASFSGGSFPSSPRASRMPRAVLPSCR